MADNVALTPGSGTLIAADEVSDGTLGTVEVQYVKLMDGALDGTAKIGGDATNGLDVDVTRLPYDVAHDGIDSGNPFKIGGKAASSAPTAVAANDRVNAWFNLRGALKVDLVTPNGDSAMDDGQDAVVVYPAGGSMTVSANGGVFRVRGYVGHDAAYTGADPLLIGGYASAAAPTNVSDGNSTQAWFLRNGAQATVLTAAGALIGGDATNGLDVDVTRVTGTVTVDSELAAAAALSDTIGNPTTAMVGSANMIWDTAGTQWVRRKQAVHGIDSTGVGHTTAAILAEVDDTATSTVTENSFGAVRMSTTRRLLVDGGLVTEDVAAAGDPLGYQLMGRYRADPVSSEGMAAADHVALNATSLGALMTSPISSGGYQMNVSVADAAGGYIAQTNQARNVPLAGTVPGSSVGRTAVSLAAALNSVTAGTGTYNAGMCAVTMNTTVTGTVTIQVAQDTSNFKDAPVIYKVGSTGLTAQSAAIVSPTAQDTYLVPVEGFDSIQAKVTSGLSGAMTVTFLFTSEPYLRSVVGELAHDAVDAGYPMKIGGYANSSAPTAVAAADRVNAWFNLRGALKVDLATPNGDSAMDDTNDAVKAIARGDTAHDAADSNDNPVKVGAKAKNALPTAVSNNDRAEAISDLWGRQLTSHIDPGMQIHKSFNATSTQTGTDVWSPTSGKKIAVTSVVIGTYGTTAGRVILWFGDNADTTYTAGTDQLLLAFSTAPSASSKPGLVFTPAVPVFCTTADRELHITTDANVSIDVAVEGYEW